MTENRALVSIVIPCYNYGRFLGEAIESALQQTYQPIEIIVVDDGSTDETAQVARRYPVSLVSQANLGVCAAINTGVKLSTGPFVMRLDADDKLASTYVEETLNALEQDPNVHFAYTEVAYFGARGGTYPVEPFDAETLAERNYIHGSALMRRRSFDLVGGYDPRLAAARCEDWDLWLAFAERGLGGVLVPRPLLAYRQHPSASRNTLSWSSLRLWKRNIAMVSYLQDNHPLLFARRSLIRRLAALPRRLHQRHVSPRFAVLLVSCYGVMLFRGARRAPSHWPSPSELSSS